MTDKDVKPWEFTRERTAFIAFFITLAVTGTLFIMYAHRTGNPPASYRSAFVPGGIAGYVVYRTILATED